MVGGYFTLYQLWYIFINDRPVRLVSCGVRAPASAVLGSQATIHASVTTVHTYASCLFTPMGSSTATRIAHLVRVIIAPHDSVLPRTHTRSGTAPRSVATRAAPPCELLCSERPPELLQRAMHPHHPPPPLDGAPLLGNKRGSGNSF